MLPELPPRQKIQINQREGAAKPGDLDALDAVMIVLPETARTKPWPSFTHSEILQQRYRAQGKKPSQTLLTHLPNATGTTVAIGFAKPDATAFELLTTGRQLATHALSSNPARVGVLAPGLGTALETPAVAALTAALLAVDFRLPAIKGEPSEASRLKSLHLLGLRQKADLRRTLAEAAGNNLARWLTTLPGNYLTPVLYRRKLQKLAREHGWQYEFLDEAKLKQNKAGALLAVTRASEERDAGIAHLRYTPSKRARRGAVALVGKGICFDTGGTNLKSAKSMLGMHGDMQGSAVALGMLLALSELRVDFPVDIWLALAQNLIGPKAYKPNDVVIASNGVSIEVVHTDAEGRMVLADTLALAGKSKPAALLDFATLTGSCIYALGTRYSGAFTNRIELADTLIRAGRDSGERVWPFPNDADYDEQLDSKVADIKQCLIEGEADHILAARFLNRFVDKQIPWVHIDLAASESKGGLAHIPTDITGFGIRYGLSLLLDQKLGG